VTQSGIKFSIRTSSGKTYMRVPSVDFKVSNPAALSFSVNHIVQRTGEATSLLLSSTPSVPVSSYLPAANHLNNELYLQLVSSSAGLDLSAATVSKPGVSVDGTPTKDTLNLKITGYTDLSLISLSISGVLNPVPAAYQIKVVLSATLTLKVFDGLPSLGHIAQQSTALVSTLVPNDIQAFAVTVSPNFLGDTSQLTFAFKSNVLYEASSRFEISSPSSFVKPSVMACTSSLAAAITCSQASGKLC